ncbi:hypothetical protein FHS57_003406 [Runella defluvii]|uniref:Uncharacterized protein n=1 Tax=Runella defluvii TaxID=370973 RepID=A0A7W6ER82_9BACT|nr:hypothetical protein [Runella defluvii]MBB3839400.1 hypothetical protein [Runella defluvii]
MNALIDKHLTAEQVAKINEMHPQVIKNFQGREWFSILGFLLVAACPFLTKRKQEIYP